MTTQKINQHRAELLLDAAAWLTAAAKMIENQEYENVPASVWGHMAVGQNSIQKCFETLNQEENNE